MRSVWRWWKQVGRRIGDVQARLLLIFFYFVVLGPFALVLRWGSDPLAIKSHSPQGWRPRVDKKGSPTEQSTRQF